MVVADWILLGILLYTMIALVQFGEKYFDGPFSAMTALFLALLWPFRFIKYASVNTYNGLVEAIRIMVKE